MRAVGWIVLIVSVGLIVGRPTDVSPDGNLVDAALDLAEGKLANIPNGPRLTRGELRALVDDAMSSRRNKSLLIVLPVTASEAPLEELFTIKPVTQLVGDGLTTSPSTSSRKPIKRRRKPPPRPIYVPSTQSTFTTEAVTKGTSIKTVTRRLSTTKKTTTDQNWSPLTELAVPAGFREPLDGMSVATTQRIFVTPPKTSLKMSSTTQSSLPPADVAVAAQSLTPEMKDLLATFGLLGPDAAAAVEAQNIPSSTEGVDPLLEGAKPEVDPAAYLTFKPLPPAAGEMTPDMRGFLASFGLLPDNDKPLPSKRARKVTREERRREPRLMAKVPQVDADLLPESMASILSDLGLTGDSTKMASRSGREHVFSPSSSLDSSREATAGILVSRLRALAKDRDPFTLTTDHLRDVLGEDAVVLDGPDPINLTELLNLADAEGDNLGGEDFKRQQPDLGGLEVMDQMNISENEESTDEPSTTDEPSETYSDTSAVAVSASKSASAAALSSGSSVSASASADSSLSNNSSASGNTFTNSEPSDDHSSAATSASADDTFTSSASVSSSGSSSSSSESSAAAASSSDSSSSAAATSSSASSSADGSSSENSSADGSSSAPSSADGSSSAAAAVGDSRTTEGPSIQDLEDSFGGEITTTPRPNGLYFLLDWNSFLQVGQDERKVDLSFSPKIGDARNFYPIKFP